ncbi:hypothetical protein EDB81DRAFT_802855 [Dactylonectria macrodidyma]|uniref:Uncharacterized protein n=1 Tax=Dactylonectria macrodidyma TaxID=307937 RepID=A0A9P9ISR9_9HYPO|nr:hypothetical protein EDB81DRAFT_802855 [Dactylonectria macrodidyma]
MPAQKLPNEILQMIVGNLVPSMWNEALFPASHVITKTLIAFTRVCWATYPRATDLLWQYCLRIDSNSKACRFLQCLQSTSVEKFFHHCRHVRLYLEPYEETYPESPPEPDTPDALNPNTADAPEAYQVTFETPPPLYSPLADMPTAIVVRDILLTLAPVLKCLTIDMPLRSLYPEDDVEGVRPILRQGFEPLVHLEEFVSVRDELYLATVEGRSEPQVWATCWPKLRRLALYNLDMDPDSGSWIEIARLPCLELGVFSRADGSGFGEISENDTEQEWMAALSRIRARARRNLQHGDPSSHPLKMVFVDCVEHPQLFTWFASGLDWKTGDITLHTHFIAPGTGSFSTFSEDHDPIELCQDWMKRQIFIGHLWSGIMEVCEVE